MRFSSIKLRYRTESAADTIWKLSCRKKSSILLQDKLQAFQLNNATNESTSKVYSLCQTMVNLSAMKVNWTEILRKYFKLNNEDDETTLVEIHSPTSISMVESCWVGPTIKHSWTVFYMKSSFYFQSALKFYFYVKLTELVEVQCYMENLHRFSL